MHTLCAGVDALSIHARVILDGAVQSPDSGITFASEHAGYVRRLVPGSEVERIEVGEVRIDFPDLSPEEVEVLVPYQMRDGGK